MELRAMKKMMYSAIAIFAAAVLALGCEWSGGSPDAGKRDILEFKLPAKKAAPAPVVEKVAEVLLLGQSLTFLSSEAGSVMRELPEAAESLIGSANKREDRGHIERVVRWLGSIASDRAVQFLLARLADGNWAVRADAAEALGNIGAEETVAGLASLLNDEIYDCRCKAVRAAVGLAS